MTKEDWVIQTKINQIKPREQQYQLVNNFEKQKTLQNSPQMLITKIYANEKSINGDQK